jgi:hypothetical protein
LSLNALLPACSPGEGGRKDNEKWHPAGEGKAGVLINPAELTGLASFFPF